MTLVDDPVGPQQIEQEPHPLSIRADRPAERFDRAAAVFDQPVALMLSVSPLETLIVPWLVKLGLPIVKLPPLKPALIVPALTMPLPARLL